MKKRKFIYALLMSAMLSVAVCGCGSNETIEDDLEVKTTEAPSSGSVDMGMSETTETPTEAPTETPTEAPTETPVPNPLPTEAPIVVIEPSVEPVVEPTEVPTEVVEPTEVPQKADWLADNGYTVNGVGAFSYNGLVDLYNAEGVSTLGTAKVDGTFDMSEVDNGDGTKTVTAVITTPTYKDEYGWSAYRGFAFVVDRHTGTAFINFDFNQDENFTVTFEDGTEISLTIYMTQGVADTQYEDMVDTFKVTVPADYDGLVFGVAPTQGFKNWGSTLSITELTTYFPNDTCEFVFFSK